MEKVMKESSIKLYNLIIIDESGSMSGLRDATLLGINETIRTIKAAQKEYRKTQQHFLSIITFNSSGLNGQSVRTVVDAVPIDGCDIFSNYFPKGSTPLYDAMGESLTYLRKKINDDRYSYGIVTILTDGLENASNIWLSSSLYKLIRQLKDQGWAFSYMGSTHNVKEVADILSIDNVMEFSHDVTGAYNTWMRERSAKRNYYKKINSYFEGIANDDDNIRLFVMKKYASELNSSRITPSIITKLNFNDVIVFGGKKEGYCELNEVLDLHIGEIINGELGHFYSIPVQDGKRLMQEAIHNFCSHAKHKSDSNFLVFENGYIKNGYYLNDIARCYREAIEIENISLPQDFWNVWGLML